MKRILLIDDDPNVRLLLGTYLESIGYELAEAENGLKGIEIFKEFSPDLLITDVVMEGMDGIEVVMNIREIDTDVKIAVISGGGRLEADHYLRMMKALGVDLTLEKPIDLRELGECVKDLIG